MNLHQYSILKNQILHQLHQFSAVQKINLSLNFRNCKIYRCQQSSSLLLLNSKIHTS